jgi:histidinol phosphatase-like PHP family hydrolase
MRWSTPIGKQPQCNTLSAHEEEAAGVWDALIMRGIEAEYCQPGSGEEPDGSGKTSDAKLLN